MSTIIQSVSILGSGRVATLLAQKMVASGIQIVDIYSRQLYNAQRLAQKVKANATTDLAALNTTSDLYLIAINDDAIESVVTELRSYLPAYSFVAHTSGATPSQVLAAFPNHGVFYPLQSFSLDQKINFSQVPFCLLGASESLIKQLEQLAQQLGAPTYRIDDQQRAQLHVAAVFANNFTNYCYYIAHQLTQEQHIPFELLQPLIVETARKLQDGSPSTLQTGPAIRGDQKTIARHLSLMENEDWKRIYQLLSEQIMDWKKTV
jgi:predicted short-subunit dehydrogenase-like oxidoreductase (DUF2520 family)